MEPRHTYLICRAAVFATLLISAGATSVSVAAGAEDARQPELAGDSHKGDFAQARSGTETLKLSSSF